MTESERRRCAERLRLALDLFETGVELQRARWRREDPTLSPDQLEQRLSLWLRAAPTHATADGLFQVRSAAS